jgi:peptide deformylase
MKTDNDCRISPDVCVDHRPLAMRTDPDPVLRKHCATVQKFDSALRAFAEEMLVFMRQSCGIGLAAPQVGVLQRIVVVDVGGSPLCLANPVIVAGSGTENMVEGCLSLPEVEVDVRRKTSLEIYADNLEGEQVRLDVDGLMARVLQHELDHLDGRLIVDHGEIIQACPEG